MMNIDDTNGPKMPKVDVDWQRCERDIRNQALEDACDAIGMVNVPVGSTSIIWAAQDAIRALKT